jgi:uncharacterized protein YdhG (YjbR/CyaY superfamily)
VACRKTLYKPFVAADTWNGLRANAAKRMAAHPRATPNETRPFPLGGLGRGLGLGSACSIARMKKVRSGNRCSAAKGNDAPKNVDEYLSFVPEPARSTLNKMREAIRSAVPREATEAISYGIPAFKHKRVLVWFGAFSNHCSLFPTASVIEKFKNELKAFSTSKGTIHFPTDKPLPVALIKKLVKARVAQSEGKKRR